ncbi:MAG: hypothetical protein AB7O96_12915 [Pseudobdellovibrionaceae bacterium]
MRFFILGFTLTLVSSIAFAYPTVGDSIELTGAMTAIDFDGSMPMSLSFRLAEFDPSTKYFRRIASLIVGEGSHVEDEWIAKKEFMTNEKVAELLANCVPYGGRSEALVTSAGTFETCVFTKQDSDGIINTTWYGDVPFGMIKLRQKYPTYTVDLEVSEFRHGQ